jgi:serine/threonine-protein phosphatase 6 regulatory ankyrin repeat subunit B
VVDIFISIETGDLAGVQTALAQGVSPNALGGILGLCPLDYAAIGNQPAIFELLVTHGANINTTDQHHNTPLFYAARAGGSKTFIDYIIKSGAQINIQTELGQTPLHVAVTLGKMGAVDSLLSHGANVNIKDYIGNTALHDAIMFNQPNAILPLIEYGASLSIENNHLLTPIQLAENASATIQEIFALPILSEIKIPTNNALLEAAAIDDVPGAQAALASGVQPNSTNSDGYTGVHYAALNGSSDMIQELVTQGGSFVNQTTKEGYQPIHIAAMAHQLDAVETLVNLHAAINAVDYQGNTPLHYAVQDGGSAAFVTEMIQLGASVNAVNNQGQTPLHLAALADNLAAVEVLVANHANVTIEDHHGQTAQADAITAHAADVVAFLEEQNANDLSTILPNAKNNVDAIKLSDVISMDQLSNILSENSASHNAPAQTQQAIMVPQVVMPEMTMTVETLA